MVDTTLPTFWQRLLKAGLGDDGQPWDWTSLALPGRGRANGKLQARIIAKAPGIWAGEGAVQAVASHFKAVSRKKDGERVQPGQVVAEWNGPARDVLGLERPFLNLVAYASGIATLTRAYVDLAQKACPKRTPRIVGTRKILPHYRDLAIHAIQVGGGVSHRVDLSGGVLIKENHVAAAGGIARAIGRARAIAPHTLKIEVEVRDERELKQALRGGADIIMLDNFSPQAVRAALKVVGPDSASGSRVSRPLIEVSGGITLSTIAAYAIPGVDVISVGSLTHSVQSLDLSLLVKGT